MMSGKYFTTNKELQNCVYKFIKNNPSCILEPSIGRGDLVQFVQNNTDAVFDMFEIDPTISLLETIDSDKVVYGDFLKKTVGKKYTTILGNPPYIRTKKGNLYIDFIEKCFTLLENEGELIFIVPSDFFKLTCAKNVLELLMSHGTFTDIYHPNKENLFENASIDVLVFRYCKDKDLDNIVLYNGKEKYIHVSHGLVTFLSEPPIKEQILFKDLFDIRVGLVSGREKVFKNSLLGNIEVLNSKGKKDLYILLKEFPTTNNAINAYLLKNKSTLMERQIRKFTKYNWFEWGALRNIKCMEEHKGKECVYIHTLTRSKKVAFKGEVGYFGGGILILLPKRKMSLDKIVNYLNSELFRSQFMYSGRFKIGHRTLGLSSVTSANVF